jgi:hypothetical protein
MGIVPLHDWAFADQEAVVKKPDGTNHTTATELNETEMIEARDHALRNDPRVLQALLEGNEDLAAKPPRSTVYATKEEFRRAFA